MRKITSLAALAAAAGLSLSASAAVNTTVTDTTSGAAVNVDGTIGANEYGPANAFSFGGGGTGFGGTVGNGRLFMESNATNLFLGFDPGAALNDLVVIYLDTKAGGFTDADMNDDADGGRRISSNLTRDANDVFPAGFLPDYSVVIGDFGIVVFELNAGSTPGHLAFKQFDGTFTGTGDTVREIAIPQAELGNPTAIDFLTAYGSGTNFMSNETIPAQPFNASGNPGFDNGGQPLVFADVNRFVVPEPGTLGLAAVGALGLARRRRR